MSGGRMLTVEKEGSDSVFFVGVPTGGDKILLSCIKVSAELQQEPSPIIEVPTNFALAISELFAKIAKEASQ